jgi:hypothetical protein
MPTEHEARGANPGARHVGRLDAVIVCAVLGICAVIIGGLAWSRPTMTAASLSYTQSGSLSYSAPTSPTSVYGSAGVVTGDPVYGSVVSALTVSYAYRFRATSPTTILNGAEQLVATISNGQGLTRTIALQPSVTRFIGESFTATGTLSMAALQSAAAAFAKAAVGYGSSTYAVAITPSVSVLGHLGPAPLNASFDSPVSFSYSDGALLPGTSGGASGAGGQASFASSSTGSVSVPAGQPATLLLGLSVSNARIASLVVLLASLLLGGLAGWPLLREATSEEERTRIAARYGSSIIEAEAVAAHAGVVVVELGSFEGMLQVARRLECPILHWGDAGDVYAVVDSGTLYRYRTDPALGVQPVRRSGENGTLLVRPHLTEATRRHIVSDRGSALIRGREESEHGPEV